MFEWLSEQYIKLLLNYQILLGNPSGCGTVELLRLFTFTLSVIFAFKLLLHLIIYHHLRRKFPQYTEATHPRLLRLFQNAARKVKLRRLPRLYEFNDERPLLFTIGSLKPSIFIAPKIAEQIEEREVEASLVHELIHIKRRDNLLLWFLEIFFVSIPVLFVQIFALSFIYSLENSVYVILGALVVLTLFKAFLWKRIIYLRELSCDDVSVDKIKDPLILASSLVNVWRLGKALPKYRWQRGLSFAQTLLPASLKLENRVQRLLNYTRPWFKFLVGRALRWLTLGLVVFTVAFLWRFYSNDGHLHIKNENSADGHICAPFCQH